MTAQRDGLKVNPRSSSWWTAPGSGTSWGARRSRASSARRWTWPARQRPASLRGAGVGRGAGRQQR